MEKLAAKDATPEKKRLREKRAAETDRVKGKKPKRRRDQRELSRGAGRDDVVGKWFIFG